MRSSVGLRNSFVVVKAVLLCLSILVCAHADTTVRGCPTVAPEERTQILRTTIPLDENGCLKSASWLDQKDAEEKIRQRISSAATLKTKDKITPEEAALLTQFSNHGWLITSIDLDDGFLQSLQTSLHNAWQQKPDNVLGAEFKQKPKVLSDFPSDYVVGPGTRLVDAHTEIPELKKLATHPKIHRIVELILQDIPVTTQSLYFPYGSMQSLHRDPWYVITTPVENMVACWIALEDIHADSGPLSFVGDSHRLPYTPLLNTKDIIFHDVFADGQTKQQHIDAMLHRVNASQLSIGHFTAKKGQVFFWHSGLIHGGSPVHNPRLTRQSFVLHFDKLRHHPRKGAVYTVEGKKRAKYCDKVYISDECAHAFVAPVSCDTFTV